MEATAGCAENVDSVTLPQVHLVTVCTMMTFLHRKKIVHL